MVVVMVVVVVVVGKGVGWELGVDGCGGWEIGVVDVVGMAGGGEVDDEVAGLVPDTTLVVTDCVEGPVEEET